MLVQGMGILESEKDQIKRHLTFVSASTGNEMLKDSSKQREKPTENYVILYASLFSIELE